MEKKSESDSFFGDYDSAIKPINRAKNRYSNVLPRMYHPSIHPSILSITCTYTHTRPSFGALVKRDLTLLYAVEKTRVKLKHKNHVEGSDYINANWVDVRHRSSLDRPLHTRVLIYLLRWMRGARA